MIAGVLARKSVLVLGLAFLAWLAMTGVAGAQEAADNVIHEQLTSLGGDGGVVLLGPDGEPAWSFNSAGMYRAFATSDGKNAIEIYEFDEDTFD